MVSAAVVEVASIDVQRTFGIFGDDVDHSTDGIGTIERGGSSFYDFYPLDVVYIYPVIVYVIKGFARHSFAIHQEKNIFPAESHHVDIRTSAIVCEIDT